MARMILTDFRMHGADIATCRLCRCLRHRHRCGRRRGLGGVLRGLMIMAVAVIVALAVAMSVVIGLGAIG